jgi:prophage DNA circulation protein
LVGSQTDGGFGCCFASGCVWLTVVTVSFQDFWTAIDAITTSVLDLVSALWGTIVACRVNVNGVDKAVVIYEA